MMTILKVPGFLVACICLANNLFAQGFHTDASETNNNDRINSLTVTDQRDIIVAGYYTDCDGRFHSLLGGVDSTGKSLEMFSANGFLLNLLDDSQTTVSAFLSVSIIDSQIVAAGFVAHSDTHVNSVVIRLDSNGTLDNTFGTNGRFMHDFSAINYVDRIISIATVNNTIVVAGNSIRPLLSNSNVGGFDFFVAKITASGELDRNFASNGIFWKDIGQREQSDNVASVLVDLDGTIIVGGTSIDGNGTPSPALLRLTSNGQLDTEFASGGEQDLFSTKAHISQYSLLSPDGIIYGAGSTSNNDFMIIAFHSNGTLVDQFARNGIFTQSRSHDDVLEALVILEDSSILAVGRSNGYAILLQLSVNGQLNASFGDEGIYTFETFSNWQPGSFSALAAYEGEIIVGGYDLSRPERTKLSDEDITLVKIKENGVLDLCFANIELPLAVSIMLNNQSDSKSFINGRVDIKGILELQPPITVKLYNEMNTNVASTVVELGVLFNFADLEGNEYRIDIDQCEQRRATISKLPYK